MIATPYQCTRQPPALLAYPFRPFFLLAGVYGALLIAAWIAFLFAGLPLPLGVAPAQWHAHEMLFGWVPAAIAGFLLTAMCNWTGAAPLRGGWLLALVGLWLAGRIAMWASGVLPAALVAAVDLVFVPTVTIYAARVLQRHGDRRNRPLVVVLGLLTGANLLMHLGFSGVYWPGIQLGQRLAFDLVAVVVTVIGGRITPAFTANWLRAQGQDPGLVRRSEGLDRAALVLALLLVPAELLPGEPWPTGLAALAAGLVAAARVVQWRGWLAAREPLLWILHLGMAWLAFGYLLRAAAPLLDLAPAAWMHALGAGAMGTLVLGVMTRVALGHTGRPLRLPRGAVWGYAAVSAAALLRLGAALGWLTDRGWIAAAGLAWVAAFVLFVVQYAPILASPRADGRPG